MVINAELENIHMWFSANRLSLNVAKTNYMFFGKRKLPVDIYIKINKEIIKRVSVTKFLGVMIDDKLTWKHHIDLVKSKLSRSCAVMYRASFLIDKRGMHVLYFSLFLPYIMYCAEIWGNSYSTSSKCLCRRKRRLRPLTSHTAAPNARGRFRLDADWRCIELAGAALDSALPPDGASSLTKPSN